MNPAKLLSFNTPIHQEPHMALSWLTALKVVPWEKVLEHAPGVLDKARGFIDKRRQTAAEPPTELAQLAQAQQQMAQALAEVAEQNAALIAAVTRLKRQLRWLALALVLASSAFVAIVVLRVG
jgi:hypothetical protein